MRLEAGLTPAALAEKVGVPRQTVADLEAGKIETPVVALGRLTAYPPWVILPSAAIRRAPHEGQVRHGS